MRFWALVCTVLMGCSTDTLQTVPPPENPRPLHHVAQIGIVIVVVMGDEHRVQFVQRQIGRSHRGHRTVARIKEQELAVDKDSGAGLRAFLGKGAGDAAQNGGDPVRTLQLDGRFGGLFLIVDHDATDDSFRAVLLPKQQAYRENDNAHHCSAGDEITFGDEHLLV